MVLRGERGVKLSLDKSENLEEILIPRYIMFRGSSGINDKVGTCSNWKN